MKIEQVNSMVGLKSVDKIHLKNHYIWYLWYLIPIYLYVDFGCMTWFQCTEVSTHDNIENSIEHHDLWKPYQMQDLFHILDGQLKASTGHSNLRDIH